LTTWTNDELAGIAAAEELEIQPLRPDGTPRNPVPIWVVRHDDGLYVRSYKGTGASWYRAAQVRQEGHVRAGGVDMDVTFVTAGDEVNDQIDAAYRTKYGHYGARFINPMVAPEARATTIKLVPR
jgi:hypothetical protein